MQCFCDFCEKTVLTGRASCQSPCFYAILKDYLKLTRSQYGIDSFDELLDFAKKCKAYVPHVVLTIVDTTIPEKDVEICKQIAQNIGVTLRIRPFED